MRTKKEKLLAKYTFASFLEKSRVYEQEHGLMSMSHVMKLQMFYANEAEKCVRCGTTENLTADHIFPIVFLKMLGYPAERMWRHEWYQPLCRSCNSSKRIRVEWEHPNTKFIIETALHEKPGYEYATLQKETAKFRAQNKDRDRKVFRLTDEVQST